MLSHVVQTRGSVTAPATPSAEPALVIEHREALIYMICAAAELEHALMCEYLFAAFSLKESTDEGLSEEQAAAVNRWRSTVLGVAGQEMLHLALTANMLTALGTSRTSRAPTCPSRHGTTRPRSNWLCSPLANRPCATSCTSNAPRAWPSTTLKGWGPWVRPPRSWRLTTSSRTAKTS